MSSPRITQPATAAPSAGGRVRRSLLSWTGGLAAALIMGGVGFLATPWLVRWLHDGPWGAWAIIGEWLGYLGLGQMALGPGAMTVLLLRAQGSGAAADYTALVKRGWRLYTRAALALIPLALALAWFAPRLLRAPAELASPFRLATAIAALGSLLVAPPLIFRSLLETAQRGYLVRAALLAQSLLITALSLAGAWCLRGGRWGIAAIAAASLAGMLLGAFLWYRASRPWLAGWGALAPAPLPRGELWRINRPLVLALLGNQINTLADATVLGLRWGAAAVTPFALTQTLLLLAGGQLSEVGSVSWAALGELRAARDARFHSRVIELAAAVLGAGCVLVAIPAVYNRAFLGLWVGPRLYAGNALTWWTAASVVVFGFICFFGWLIDTQGDTRLRLRISIVGAALNLALSLALVRRWGGAGVAFATLAAYCATDAWNLPRIAVRHYGVPALPLARALFAALFHGGLWVVAIAAAARLLPAPHSWTALIAQLAAWTALGLLYCWRRILRPDDRGAWRLRLLRLRGSLHA